MRQAILQHARFRQPVLTAVICCLCVSQSIADDAPKRPFIVGSVRSLESVRDNIQQIFDSAGCPEKARTLEALALLATAGRGAEGIDTTRPCGFAFDVDAANDTAETATWYFLPISDKKSFVRLIKVFSPKLEQRKPGLYRFGPTSDYRMKLTEGWAFIYQASKTDPVFPDPAKMISENARNYDAAISVNLSVIPRKLMKEFTDLNDQPNGGETNPFGQLMSQIYRDGEELVIGYRASRTGKNDNAVVDFEFKPRSGSPSAIWLANSARTPNRFARLVDDNAVVSTKVSFPVDFMRSTIQSNVANGSLVFLVEQLFRDQLSSNAKFNAKWKQTLEKLVKANSSLKQFDCALSIGGADRPSIFAHQLADAKQLEPLLTEMIKLHAGDLKDIVTANAAIHAGQNIHTVNWRTTDVDETERLLIGDERKVHVTFLDDAVIYTAGPNGLQRMKSAIDTLQSPAKPPKTETPTSPFELELALGSILRSAADDDDFVKMAVKNFKTDDRLRVAIEVLRDRSRLRLEFGEAYPRFLGKAYAFAYEEYLLAGTLSDLSTDDLGLSMLGLLASVPFGVVQFVPTVMPDPNVPLIGMGGVVGGKVVGQASGQLQSVIQGTSEARYIAAAIARIGPDAVPSLAKAVASEKQHVANAASVSLQSIEKIDVAIPTLIKILKDEKAEAWRKQTALTLVGKIGKPANAAIPVVLKMLKSDDWQNRRAMIDCIQKIGESPAEVVEILIEMAKGESPKRTSTARATPVQSVSYSGWNQENSDQHWALDQLAVAGEQALPAIPTLLDLLHAENNQTRRRAAATIGRIGPDAIAALPALKRAHQLEILIQGVNQQVLHEAITKVEGTTKRDAAKPALPSAKKLR
ncbi:MAG: hypothetical protein O3A00_03780 [Planctomycetota bacterium]|nr:hypothetical protein [Planctomycetota bacterium]